jgi:hypothetical protein
VAVATVTQWRITQGRRQDFLAASQQAKKIHERLGGRVHLWGATLAGPNSALASYVIEHDDFQSYARFTEKLAADAEWQAFFATTVNHPDPVATLVSNSLATEIPL